MYAVELLRTGSCSAKAAWYHHDWSADRIWALNAADQLLDKWPSATASRVVRTDTGETVYSNRRK